MAPSLVVLNIIRQANWKVFLLPPVKKSVDFLAFVLEQSEQQENIDESGSH